MDDRADILLLIQARLHGWPGSNASKGKRSNLPEQTIAGLLKGKAGDLEIGQLYAIARKAGISPKKSPAS